VRLSGLAFLLILSAALCWASWAAFRPEARAAVPSPTPTVDPEVELARMRAGKRADAVDAAVALALLEHGATRGDVRFETRDPPGPAGFPHAELAIDVLGPADPLADAIAGRVQSQDGVSVQREPHGKDSTRVAISIDGTETTVLDLYPALIDPLPDNGGRPRVAIVIDDIGYARPPVEKFLAISKNLTFSVLPFAPDAAELAELIHSKGAEVMLHLPMEPDRGPAVSKDGMLMHDMSAEELTRRTLEAIERVPHADGVNNHMGSRLTADAVAMKTVMAVLAGKNLFFLDSRTSPQTVAYREARAAGLPALERDVFLDDVAEIGPVLKQVAELEARAKKRGMAVAIGHPYPATITAMAQAVPSLIDDGFEIVSVHDLVRASPLTPLSASGTP
jgi:uncharacterized protein